jgi:histidyl-tRNA synthetase
MVAVVARPTGLNDKLPAAVYAAREVEARLQECMEAFGYRLVETPVVEYSELFLRKSGEGIVDRLFTFEHRGRSLCLRPECTASIGRLFVEQLQHTPKPIRLQFAGPVFRYESPSRTRSRQFTALGAELIGVDGEMADAEIIALACEGLKWIGVTDFTLVVGHVGVVSQFLRRLNLDTRARQFLLTNMENLRKPEKGRAYVHDQLERLYPEPAERINRLGEKVAAFDPGDPVDGPPDDLEQEIHRVLDMMVESQDAVWKSSRGKEEIAERLLLKLRRPNEVRRIGYALDFIEKLGQIKGSPDEVFQGAEHLLDAYELDTALLGGLQEMVRLLVDYGIPERNITVDMGLGRGVHYYTGMVFEIHTSPLRGDSQGTPVTWEPRTDVLVAPVSQQEIGYAIEVAQHLRRRLHLCVELKLNISRGLGEALKYASRNGIPYVIILGADERDRRAVSVRKMVEREQVCLPFDELVQSAIFSRRSDGREYSPA